jgi:hypothetical protein
MQLTTTEPTGETDAELIRAYILAQADGYTPATQERYATVADALETFRRSIDVGPWLGPEISDILERHRAAGGDPDLLGVLGMVSFIRVLPAFLEEPWLPPRGSQRTTHRTAIRRLVTLLRRRAAELGCLNPDDLAAISHQADTGSWMLREDGGWPEPSDTMMSCTVTLRLEQHLLDRLLAEVDHGSSASIEEALEHRLNPRLVTYWEDPEPDYYPADRRWW